MPVLASREQGPWLLWMPHKPSLQSSCWQGATSLWLGSSCVPGQFLHLLGIHLIIYVFLHLTGS